MEADRETMGGDVQKNHVEPVPEDYMKDQEIWGNTTLDQETDICTVLRGIYHRSDNEEVRLRCRIATTMATKMRGKLLQYKFKLGGNMNVLNLGCGLRHMVGAVNVDAYECAKPDVLHDLNVTPYPFENDEFDRIYAHHVFEHLPNWWGAFEECGRILKPGGILEISVPAASSDTALTYKDHVRVFAQCSFHGAYKPDGKAFVSGTNAWAAGISGTVPLKMVKYEQTPHGKYNWMMHWPFKGLLAFCSEHLRNFIWQQTFTFQKFDRGIG